MREARVREACVPCLHVCRASACVNVCVCVVCDMCFLLLGVAIGLSDHPCQTIERAQRVLCKGRWQMGRTGLVHASEKTVFFSSGMKVIESTSTLGWGNHVQRKVGCQDNGGMGR